MSSVLNICSPDPANHVSGWCAIECCDSNYEECYEYDDGYSKQHTNQYCAAVRLCMSMPPSHCHSNVYHLINRLLSLLTLTTSKS